MNNKEMVDPLIRTLTQIKGHIDSHGGSDENVEFFDMYLETRKDILDRYGLPEISEFTKILDFKDSPTESEIEQMLENLAAARRCFTLSPENYDIQVIEDYIQNYKDPNDLFSHLEITPHPYMFFVYLNILNERKDTVRSGLEAMRLADEPNILNLLTNLLLYEDNSDQKEDIIRFLMGSGVKYLDEYLLRDHDSDGGRAELTNKLVQFWYLISDHHRFSDHEELFKNIANLLMNHLCLVVNKQPFRIIECEFYYFDELRHRDPYVHRANEQQHAGNWYYTGAGLDITFGNIERKSFGGILIRGLKRLEKNQTYISGPSNVLKEVFNNIGSVLHSGRGLFLQELISKTEVLMVPIQTTRIGLLQKEIDRRNFKEKPYRFIVELNIQHKFKDKRKVVNELISKGAISENEAHDIMGYRVRSKLSD